MAYPQSAAMGTGYQRWEVKGMACQRLEATGRAYQRLEAMGKAYHPQSEAKDMASRSLLLGLASV